MKFQIKQTILYLNDYLLKIAQFVKTIHDPQAKAELREMMIDVQVTIDSWNGLYRQLESKKPGEQIVLEAYDDAVETAKGQPVKPFAGTSSEPLPTDLQGGN